jgi:hypothetical protein
LTTPVKKIFNGSLSTNKVIKPINDNAFVISTQILQFIAGFFFGIILVFIFNMPILQWGFVIIIISIIYASLSLLNPLVSRFIFLLMGFSIGIIFIFIMSNFFIGFPKFH